MRARGMRQAAVRKSKANPPPQTAIKATNPSFTAPIVRGGVMVLPGVVDELRFPPACSAAAPGSSAEPSSEGMLLSCRFAWLLEEVLVQLTGCPSAGTGNGRQIHGLRQVAFNVRHLPSWGALQRGRGEWYRWFWRKQTSDSSACPNPACHRRTARPWQNKQPAHAMPGPGQ